MPEPFKYDGLIMLLSQAGANLLDPLEMEMQRTLPRESQGAVCLNRPFHRRMHGFLNQQLRHQEPRFGTRVGGRHINGGAGVMQGKPRIIQRHAMVRERMLDGLIAADRPTKLRTLAGIFNRQFQGAQCRAQRFGKQQGPAPRRVRLPQGFLARRLCCRPYRTWPPDWHKGIHPESRM